LTLPHIVLASDQIKLRGQPDGLLGLCLTSAAWPSAYIMWKPARFSLVASCMSE